MGKQGSTGLFGRFAYQDPSIDIYSEGFVFWYVCISLSIYIYR